MPYLLLSNKPHDQLVADNLSVINALFSALKNTYNASDYAVLSDKRCDIFFDVSNNREHDIPEIVQIAFPNKAEIKSTLAGLLANRKLQLNREAFFPEKNIIASQPLTDLLSLFTQMLYANAAETLARHPALAQSTNIALSEGVRAIIIVKALETKGARDADIKKIIDQETKPRVFEDVNVPGDGSCYYYAVLMGLLNSCLTGEIADDSPTAIALKQENGLFLTVERLIKKRRMPSFRFRRDETIQQWVEQLIGLDIDKLDLLQTYLAPALRIAIADFAEQTTGTQRDELLREVEKDAIHANIIHEKDVKTAIAKSPTIETIKMATEDEFTAYFNKVRAVDGSRPWGSAAPDSLVIKQMCGIEVKSFDKKSVEVPTVTAQPVLWIRNLGVHFHAGFLKNSFDFRMMNFCDQVNKSPTPPPSTAPVSPRIAPVAAFSPPPAVPSTPDVSPLSQKNIVASPPSEKELYKSYCDLGHQIMLLAGDGESINAKVLEWEKVFNLLSAEQRKKTSFEKKLKAWLGHAELKPGSCAHQELTELLRVEKEKTASSLNNSSTMYSDNKNEVDSSATKTAELK